MTSASDNVIMEPTSTALELLKLSGDEASALDMLDKMLTYFSNLDRSKTVGEVVDDWLDVRIDIRRVESEREGSSKVPAI